MKTKLKLLTCAFFLLCLGAAVQTSAQKAPDYKISAIKIMPFDGQTGAFQDEFKAGGDRSFFNDLAISLLVTVEISGQAGSFEEGRNIEVIVTEGKKQKAKKLEQIGLIGEGGKFYVPVWLDAAMCDEVTIKARITGQKTLSNLSRKVSFMCGE